MKAIGVSTKQKIAVLAFGLVLLPAARAQSVDTSEWVCEFCPFESGQRSELAVGASSVSDDSAYFGDASGYSEKGVYANLDGDGAYRSETHRLEWQVEDLGLDSRFGELRGGRPGSFDYELAYRQLPRHRYFTSESIFTSAADGTLNRPDVWTPAPLTSGFTDLDASLMPRDIESERRVFEIGGRYLPADRIRLSARYRRQEHDGVAINGGSYFTQSSLLPGTFDYVTDTADVGVRYAGNNAVVSLAFHVSEFDGGEPGLSWETPFTAAPGAEIATLARPPDNSFRQLSLSGNVRLPNHPTVVSYSAAFGSMDQDAAFLPYTNNPNLSVTDLPRSNLAADVDTQNFAVSLSSRWSPRARVKLSYRYDDRDNQTAQDAWARVITDTFPSTEQRLNIPYSFERTALHASAEYRLFDTLRLSGGYDRKTVDRDFQEVAGQTEDGGWGRLRWQPSQVLQITASGGASERDIDDYDEAFAASLGQNPLMRKYHLAYRYRSYGELTVVASLPERPVSLTLNGLYADDDYRQSQLGLTAGDDLRLAADLSFTLGERASMYLSGGYEEIEATQAGSEQFSLPDWQAKTSDEFHTFGAGFRVREIAEKFDLQFDYIRSDGSTAILLDRAVGDTSRFPDLESTLDYLRMQVAYRRSERMRIDFRLRYQRLDTEDWALEGVGPASIPVVLSLGASPYDDEVWIIGLGFRYLAGGSR